MNNLELMVCEIRLGEEDEHELHEAFVFIPIAKTIQAKTSSDVAQITMVNVKTINKIQADRPLVCLFNTGSTETMIQSRALPPGIVSYISLDKRIATTSNGSFNTSR